MPLKYNPYSYLELILSIQNLMRSNTILRNDVVERYYIFHKLSSLS